MDHGGNNSAAGDNHVSDSNVSETVVNEEIAPSDINEEVQSPYTIDELAEHGMVRLDQCEEYECVKGLFFIGMGSLATKTTLVSVHKNAMSPSVNMKARWNSFCVFMDAMARRRDGQSNFEDAFFGASRGEIFKIVRYGFSHHPEVPINTTSNAAAPTPFYGIGSIILSPPKNSLDSAMETVVDECGLRHVLLCGLIRGNIEKVRRDSKQIFPSSTEFDSGVDSLLFPSKYIIWGPFANTHIFPRYIVTFKAPGLDDLIKTKGRWPTSQWMTFPLLISTLSKDLNSERKDLMIQIYADFRARRITRPQLIQRVREIAGDELLKKMIKSNPNNPFK